VEIDFWLERWDKNETGFHQAQINPYLAYFYGQKGPSPEQRQKLKVFVPLCGKSKDMLWLSQNGYKVFGVECSERAVKDFFEENTLNYKHAENDRHALYMTTDQASLVEIFQGDFFALQQKDLADVTDIFDRASLVALPAEMRRQYARKMAEIQRPGVRTLLVTLTYDQAEMNGPPFSVSQENVNELFSENFSIEKLCFKDIIDDEPRMRNRGLSSLVETVYKLTRTD
jgi:thiopurine S-methyltransferase